MAQEFSRSQRIAQEMQKKIALILQTEIKDPRVGILTTVSGIKISRDLAHAKVFITFLNDQNKDVVKNGMQALQKAVGFIRFLLRKKMSLRIIPELTFYYDTSLVEGVRMSDLLNKVLKDDKERCIDLQNMKEE